MPQKTSELVARGLMVLICFAVLAGCAGMRRDHATSHGAKLYSCPRTKITIISENEFDTRQEGGVHHWQDACGRQRRLTFYYRLGGKSVHEWRDTTPPLYLAYGSRRPLEPQEAEGRVTQSSDGMTGRTSTKLSILDDLNDLYVKVLTRSDMTSHAVQFATASAPGEGWRFLKCKNFVAKADGQVWELDADRDSEMMDRATLETLSVMLPRDAIVALSKASDARIRFCGTQVALGPARKESLVTYLVKSEAAKQEQPEASNESAATSETPPESGVGIVASEAPPIKGAGPFKFGMSAAEIQELCPFPKEAEARTPRLKRMLCMGKDAKPLEIANLPDWNGAQFYFLDDKLAEIRFMHVFKNEFEVKERGGYARYQRVVDTFDQRIGTASQTKHGCYGTTLSSGECLNVRGSVHKWKRPNEEVEASLQRLDSKKYGIVLFLRAGEALTELKAEQEKAKEQSLNETF